MMASLPCFVRLTGFPRNESNQSDLRTRIAFATCCLLFVRVCVCVCVCVCSGFFRLTGYDDERRSCFPLGTESTRTKFLERRRGRRPENKVVDGDAGAGGGRRPKDEPTKSTRATYHFCFFFSVSSALLLVSVSVLVTTIYCGRSRRWSARTMDVNDVNAHRESTRVAVAASALLLVRAAATRRLTSRAARPAD